MATTVNSLDPLLAGQDLLVLQKFWHMVNGIYLWEFVTTLDYEWSIIQGRRPYRWSIWIYSFARMTTLVAVILAIVGLDVTTPINCQAWIVFQLIFAYLAFVASSFLIVLRIIAIWNKNKVVVTIAKGTWLTNVALLILGAVRLHSDWVPDGPQSTCVPLNTESSKPTIIGILATDTVLLLIMLVGLLRLRSNRGGVSRLTRLLWKQGVIWLALAVAAEVPPVVFICLNINDAFNVMFQIPALIVMSVAATRMYCSLTDVATGVTGRTSNTAQDSRDQGSRTVLNAKPPSVAPDLLSQMEVVVHRDYVEYPTVGTIHDGSGTDISGPLGDKPHEVALDDVEAGVEK